MQSKINQDQLNNFRYITNHYFLYKPKLVPICGSINATILFCYLEKMMDDLKIDEFYHTDKLIMDKLGFGRRQLENAKKELINKCLITVVVKGNKDKKTHYVLNVDNYTKLVVEMYETYTPKCTKRTAGNARNVHTYIRSNTINKNKIKNTNKQESVDNSDFVPDADNQAACGAVFLKTSLGEINKGNYCDNYPIDNYGNRTGLFLKLKEIEGLSNDKIKLIMKEHLDCHIAEAIESLKIHHGSIKTTKVQYVLGTLKKLKEGKGFKNFKDSLN